MTRRALRVEVPVPDDGVDWGPVERVTFDPPADPVPPKRWRRGRVVVGPA